MQAWFISIAAAHCQQVSEMTVLFASLMQSVFCTEMVHDQQCSARLYTHYLLRVAIFAIINDNDWMTLVRSDIRLLLVSA